MATAYPWSPSVGETFGLIAFVVVALGGFGSVLGSLYAGLIIGLIQAVSAFWLGAIYKDIVVYGLFVALLWFRPQGLMGKGVKRDTSCPRASVSCCSPRGCCSIRWSVTGAFYRDIGVDISAGGDLGVGLEHRRRLCRPGFGRPQHVLRARRLCAAAGLQPVGLAAAAGIPFGIALSVGARRR